MAECMESCYNGCMRTQQTSPLVIGLAGYMGSGKDQVASLMGWPRWPLAEPLRRELAAQLWQTNERPVWYANAPSEVRAAFDVLASTVGGPGVLWDKPTPRPIRRLLQWYGTEYRRHGWPGYWVQRWRETYPRSRSIVAVTDVRFEDEVNAVRGEGGIVLVVRRKSVEPAVLGGEIHVSETLPAKPDSYFDGVLVNDGTLDDLRREVEKLGDLSRLRGAVPDSRRAA